MRMMDFLWPASEAWTDNGANRLVFGGLMVLVILAGIGKIIYNRQRYCEHLMTLDADGNTDRFLRQAKEVYQTS